MSRIQFELTDRCAAICVLVAALRSPIIRARNIFKTAVATRPPK